MTDNILLKGFEVEVFTGNNNSHIGISNLIEDAFEDFVKEPDKRNVEYITQPYKSYDSLYYSLMEPRKKLRRWLKKRNLTIIPSSTLCFKHDPIFERSDPFNSYHAFIQSNYGISIATSSVHINLGIDDLEKLFAAIRLTRCEAALYLALSASSPFLNGDLTGNHSQRWMQFPKTPIDVPFFRNHENYVTWIENHIKNGTMQNIRHFWSSIRPNGPQRPHKLDRLELRICDFVSDINLLLSITTLLELRVLFLFQNLENVDPKCSSKLSLRELQKICDQNELKVAKDSLNAELIVWNDGRKIICKDWIENLLEEITPLAKKLNMFNQLKPIYQVLEEGNQAMQWIKQYKGGSSIEELMKLEIENMINKEESLFNDLNK